MSSSPAGNGYTYLLTKYVLRTVFIFKIPADDFKNYKTGHDINFTNYIDEQY